MCFMGICLVCISVYVLGMYVCFDVQLFGVRSCVYTWHAFVHIDSVYTYMFCLKATRHTNTSAHSTAKKAINAINVNAQNSAHM
jgi:hypothetical protein